MKFERCQNCFGTGTVFPTPKNWPLGRKVTSKTCPVCKGKCKIPVKEK